MIVMLIVRLITAWSFQSLLGVICKTLIKCVEPIAQLIVIMCMMCCIFAVWGNVLVGWRSETSASLSLAIEVRVRVMSGLGRLAQDF